LTFGSWDKHLLTFFFFLNLFIIFYVVLVKVLRILEGDMVMDTNYMSTPGYDVGSRSGRICTEQQQQHYSGPLSNDAIEGFSGKLSLETLRPTCWERDKARRASCDDVF